MFLHLFLFLYFLYFFLLVSNYGQKTFENGALLKEHAVHSFQLRENFLYTVCLGYYCESCNGGRFLIFYVIF